MRSTIVLLAGSALLASAYSPVARPAHLPAHGVRPDAAAAAASAAAAAQRRGACARSGVLCSGRSGVAQAAMLAEPPIAVPGQMSKLERMRSRYGQTFEPEGGWASPSIETDTGFSYADLEAGVGDIASFSRGDSVRGTVLGFEPNGALIDIGVKSSAYCAIAECALEKPVRPEDVLELGATYEFLIVSREDENGQQMLSRRKVLTVKAWDLVTEMMAADTAVHGIVAAVNRGGAIIQVEGLRAFLPGSHYLPGQNPPEDLIGQPLKVKFLDVDRENNRLVVSHRKAMVDMTINLLAVGSVLAGVVTAVKPYGAFIDLGGMSGLLHISQISCDHIGDVGSVLPLGTPIKCMVISQDKSKGRVALSTKTLEAEPGDMIKNQVHIYRELYARIGRVCMREGRECERQNCGRGSSESKGRVALSTKTLEAELGDMIKNQVCGGRSCQQGVAGRGRRACEDRWHAREGACKVGGHPAHSRVSRTHTTPRSHLTAARSRGTRPPGSCESPVHCSSNFLPIAFPRIRRPTHPTRARLAIAR
jgi:small subunit ribosomal protein S1